VRADHDHFVGFFGSANLGDRVVHIHGCPGELAADIHLHLHWPLFHESYIGALLLGYYTEDGRLHYAGRAGPA